MRVLLVANFEPDGQQSMQRYAGWLQRALQARGFEVSVIRPKPFFAKFGVIPALRKYLGYVDKFLLFPRHLQAAIRDSDLVHILDHSNSMYLRTVWEKPNLITCHDVLAIRAARGAFAETQTGWSGKLLQKWILSGLRGARHILCVSAKTAEDLKGLLGESGCTVRVIHTPLLWSYQPTPVRPEGLLRRLGLRDDQPYFLHVGGNQWYKNRTGVLRIFARMIAREEFSQAALVFAGKPWTEAMRAVMREENLEGRVFQAGTITNEDLQALYSHAQALLFPSLEEGFGLPLVEAQACGCPVMTTDRPPMSEVVGNGAVLIDPSDPAKAAATIALGLQNREALRSAGFQNLARFDEKVLLDRYCTAYEAIVAGGAGL